jgi:hypothetical protein
LIQNEDVNSSFSVFKRKKKALPYSDKKEVNKEAKTIQLLERIFPAPPLGGPDRWYGVGLARPPPPPKPLLVC